MQKIGNITPTADANGEWTNGNVAAGTPPTLMEAAWFNTIQRELAAMVQGGGLTLDPVNDQQVLVALKNIFLQSGNNLSEIKTAGASAQNSAKINLNLQAFNTTSGASALTTVSSPTGKTNFYISDAGAWGVQDSVGNPLPLSINGGGSGANTLLGARVNLGISSFATTTGFTSMSSPNATVSLVIADGGDWGVQNPAGVVTPLSLGRGGTGATTAANARTNLGLGTAATKTVGTLAGQIPDMSSFSGSATAKGNFKLPNGLLVQWGSINVAAANASGDVSIDQCQIPFPNGILQCIASGTNTLTDTPCFASAEAISNQQIRIKAVTVNLTNKTITQGQVVSVSWIAIGA